MRGTIGSLEQVYVNFVSLINPDLEQPPDGSTNAMPLALLFITEYAGFLKSLEDLQKSQKSSAKCLFHCPKTRSAIKCLKLK